MKSTIGIISYYSQLSTLSAQLYRPDLLAEFEPKTAERLEQLRGGRWAVAILEIGDGDIHQIDRVLSIAHVHIHGPKYRVVHKVVDEGHSKVGAKCVHVTLTCNGRTYHFYLSEYQEFISIYYYH